MFGWFSFCAFFASRWSAMNDKGWRRNVSDKTLTATYGSRSRASCRRRSSALNTVPMPPEPSSFSSTKRPLITSPTAISEHIVSPLPLSLRWEPNHKCEAGTAEHVLCLPFERRRSFLPCTCFGSNCSDIHGFCFAFAFAVNLVCSSARNADRRVTSAGQVVLVRIERGMPSTPESELSDVIRRKLFKLVRFGIVEVSEYRACHCLLIALSGRYERAKVSWPKGGRKI